MDIQDFYDESRSYVIEIWVETTKSLEEFETCLSQVIHPLVIENHEFRLGGISCGVYSATGEIQDPEDVQGSDGTQYPTFEGVPQVEYSCCIMVEIIDYDLWSAIDRHFAFAIASGISYKFSCRYLITANCEFFICQSGTNLPTYINTCYRPWTTGELVNYRARRNRKTIELHIPSNAPYR
jgi:hypothetical protein